MHATDAALSLFELDSPPRLKVQNLGYDAPGIFGLVQFSSARDALAVLQRPFVAYVHKLLLVYWKIEVRTPEFALEMNIQTTNKDCV
jgi:hypothetical protein